MMLFFVFSLLNDRSAQGLIGTDIEHSSGRCDADVCQQDVVDRGLHQQLVLDRYECDAHDKPVDLSQWTAELHESLLQLGRFDARDLLHQQL